MNINLVTKEDLEELIQLVKALSEEVKALKPEEDNDDPEYMTPAAAARKIGVTAWTIHSWCKNPDIPVWKRKRGDGKRKSMICMAELRAYVEGKTSKK